MTFKLFSSDVQVDSSCYSHLKPSSKGTVILLGIKHVSLGLQVVGWASIKLSKKVEF